MRNVMCYDNETIKWNDEYDMGYCLHIQREDMGYFDPRDNDHDSIMACFDSKCHYGDEIEEKTADEFWNDLVWKYCSDKEIFNALTNDILPNTHARKEEDGTYHLSGCCNGEWIPFCWSLKENEVITYVKDELSVADCMTLMDHGHHAMWLPLYVYDHGGVSMHTGCSEDKWDTSMVGWIVTPMCQNHTSSDEMEATRLMQQEVEEYNDWLQGNVYRYTLYQRNGDDGDEFDDWIGIDDCGGFIGEDIIENGMTYSVGNGLEEAIKNENYEIGEAKKTVIVKWEF